MESNNEIPVSMIEQLSSRLYENAKEVGRISQLSEPSKPSLDVNTSQDLRNKLKEDALILFRVASGPREYVAHIALNVKSILH